MPAPSENWLYRYANLEHYQWRSPRIKKSGRSTFFRPQGLVECTFDTDGRYFEGRADINSQLTLAVKSSLVHHEFRERILLAWACLRCQHLLLQAKALTDAEMKDDGLVADVTAGEFFFEVDVAGNVSQAVEDAGRELVFLDDHFADVDPLDFWIHSQNSARILDPRRALARLFVYPIRRDAQGRGALKLLFVGSHQIWDGLTNYVWFRNFVYLLNLSVPELKRKLEEFIHPEGVLKRLPLPQEALYPPVEGSRARQRWFWLLTRILRHVRKPLEAGFVNPLRRRNPRDRAVTLSPTYAPLLDYKVAPPLNALPCIAKASQKGTKRLHRLCREANASIGAGCFALAALIMMEFHEQMEPNIPLPERRPFISGFPLNPRAFFNHRNEPDSLMLAFCDGILLPFLPSDLNLDGRLRLLARQAHRQLAVYQKRQNPNRDVEGALEYMGSRGPGRLLQAQYIGAIERNDSKLPPHLQTGISPQGAYPARPNMSMQTCGVSSVGRREALIKPGDFDLEADGKDFIGDYRQSFACVRPRDDEFLVGVGGSDDGLFLNASVDGNAIDPALVQEWKRRFETILDSEGEGVGREYKL